MQTYAYDLIEAQLAEAIAYHAKRACQSVTAGIAAITKLLPLADATTAPSAGIADVMCHLVNEAEMLKLLGDVYDDKTDEFFKHNDPRAFAQLLRENVPTAPHLMPKRTNRAALPPNQTHYYLELINMLQWLPGDITHVRVLTDEQRAMCRLVHCYAGSTRHALANGIITVKRLMRRLRKLDPDDPVPGTACLLDQLTVEVVAMAQHEHDYLYAALHAPAKRYAPTVANMWRAPPVDVKNNLTSFKQRLTDG